MRAGTARARRRNGLRIEAALIYGVAPLVMALAMPADWLFPLLFALSAVGLILLHRTPGFRWRQLWAPQHVRWGFVLLCTLAVALVCAGVMLLWHPRDLFALPRQRPQLWGMILVLYPFLSALPQELVYRVLFFRRYRAILPRRGARLLNAAVFALAHLMYWSALVAALTFAAGWVLATAFARHRSFAEAVVIHAIAGNLVFTFGLGLYFYSGNVVRPF